MNKEREHERDCMNPRDKNKEEKISGDKRDRDKSEETRRYSDSERERGETNGRTMTAARAKETREAETEKTPYTHSTCSD
jgi:hypothetical protein